MLPKEFETLVLIRDYVKKLSTEDKMKLIEQAKKENPENYKETLRLIGIKIEEVEHENNK